jgi:pantoate--beta-alanine ligase
VELADAGNLRILDHWDGHTPVVALVAAYSGQVRLIDNDIIFS